MAREELFHFSGEPRNLYWYYERSGEWPRPFCKLHSIEMNAPEYGSLITCEDCKKPIELIKPIMDYKQYIHRKIQGRSIGRYKTVRIDQEGSEVLAREEIKTNPNYYVDAKLSDTNGGLQLMIIVGKRDGSGRKVQLFVEPGTKRLNFDRNENDQHPTGLFTEVRAKFKDSSISINEDPADASDTKKVA